MNTPIKYNFYATLLDSYQNWLSSNEIYNEFWGFSENPAKSEDEFEQEQFQSLINRINRIPMAWEDSEKADRGTAFNEVVDCIIENRKSEKMQIRKLYKGTMETDYDEKNGIVGVVPIKTDEVVGIRVDYNNRTFDFPISICREFSNYFKGAVPQVLTEAILSTKYGDVLLYGYIDELMPDSVHDIKTTSRYKAGKFKNNWQHIVYPYCLNQNGNDIRDFEYNVAVINEKKSGVNYSTFTEYYSFNKDRDIPKLTVHVEGLIEFIERNRHLITDKKIFNELIECVSIGN